MLSSKLVSASVIALSLTTASTQAVEVSLNGYLGNLLDAAVTVTKQEIQYSVEEAVLNFSHTFNLNESEIVKSDVSITELAQADDLENLEGEQAE